MGIDASGCIETSRSLVECMMKKVKDIYIDQLGIKYCQIQYN